MSSPNIQRPSSGEWEEIPLQGIPLKDQRETAHEEKMGNVRTGFQAEATKLSEAQASLENRHGKLRDLSQKFYHLKADLNAIGDAKEFRAYSIFMAPMYLLLGCATALPLMPFLGVVALFNREKASNALEKVVDETFGESKRHFTYGFSSQRQLSEIQSKKIDELFSVDLQLQSFEREEVDCLETIIHSRQLEKDELGEVSKFLSKQFKLLKTPNIDSMITKMEENANANLDREERLREDVNSLINKI